MYHFTLFKSDIILIKDADKISVTALHTRDWIKRFRIVNYKSFFLFSESKTELKWKLVFKKTGGFYIN